MKRPEPGLCFPVSIVKVRDPDTIVLRIQGTALEWAARLIGVWGPELHSGNQRQQARAGTAWLEEYLYGVDPDDLLWFIPLPEDRNILKALTFDRVPSYVFAGEVLVNKLIVSEGYASSRKGGRLGE